MAYEISHSFICDITSVRGSLFLWVFFILWSNVFIFLVPKYYPSRQQFKTSQEKSKYMYL